MQGGLKFTRDWHKNRERFYLQFLFKESHFKSFLNKPHECKHLMLSIFSPYSRTFSPNTSQTSSTIGGMSTAPYVTCISPASIVEQSQIMWSNGSQHDDFLNTRAGKLPDFQRIAPGCFSSQPKNTHYTTNFTQVKKMIYVQKKVSLKIFNNSERLEQLDIAIDSILEFINDIEWSWDQATFITSVCDTIKPRTNKCRWSSSLTRIAVVISQ